jgi:glyoxylase-like metal-dependent hydrolase (beta-lactamase superfamily II)
VYFVGTYQASSHVIDTGAGLIMIDTGYIDTEEYVLESLKELGFSITDSLE